ncbi:MAG: DUF983 domain-containing protein [Rhodospirillales bacterium]|nr:DUF983 domain-containing protein [Rhodospirillales bacterium]
MVQPTRTTRRWVREGVPDATPRPPLGTALVRGFTNRCPNCGQAPVFNGYLRVVAQCAHCGAPLGELHADDAPPYITLLLVGHIVVALLLGVERAYAPSTGLEIAIFVPLTAVLILGLLRPIKGATVGAMLALGFLRPSDA